jgi:hypothetical protein
METLEPTNFETPSKMSTTSSLFVPSVPPATSTVPELKSVAVASDIGLPIEPVVVNVVPSYSSALLCTTLLLDPPAMSTFPDGRRAATWEPRVFVIRPAAAKVLLEGWNSSAALVEPPPATKTSPDVRSVPV